MIFVSNLKQLMESIAPHQLERDLGGSMAVSKYFPFPLHAGPFAVGHSEGPNPKALAGLHQVFTATGARGCLWDSRRSDEQNTSLQFAHSDAALELLRACGIEASQEEARSGNSVATRSTSTAKVPKDSSTAVRQASGSTALTDTTAAESPDLLRTAVDTPTVLAAAIAQAQHPAESAGANSVKAASAAQVPTPPVSPVPERAARERHAEKLAAKGVEGQHLLPLGGIRKPSRSEAIDLQFDDTVAPLCTCCSLACYTSVRGEF